MTGNININHNRFGALPMKNEGQLNLLIRRCLITITTMIITGCGPGIIENSSVISDESEIFNTDENRDIVSLIETYQQALEDKDVGTLQRYISNDYYENAGTTQTTQDDYGFSGLNDVFNLFGENVRQINVHVSIRDIQIDGNLANVYLDYSYNMLYVIDGQERWQVDSDINRIELVLEPDNQWRFIHGL